MKNMKLKKTLVATGAVMVLGLAGQAMATPAPASDPIYDPSAGYDQFNAEMKTFCKIKPVGQGNSDHVKQPFADPDPTWNCGDTTRTYKAVAGVPS